MQPAKPFDQVFQKQQTEAEAVSQSEYSHDPNVHMSREAMSELSNVMSESETGQGHHQGVGHCPQLDSRGAAEYYCRFLAALCARTQESVWSQQGVHSGRADENSHRNNCAGASNIRAKAESRLISQAPLMPRGHIARRFTRATPK